MAAKIFRETIGDVRMSTGGMNENFQRLNARELLPLPQCGPKLGRAHMVHLVGVHNRVDSRLALLFQRQQRFLKLGKGIRHRLSRRWPLYPTPEGLRKVSHHGPWPVEIQTVPLPAIQAAPTFLLDA